MKALIVGLFLVCAVFSPHSAAQRAAVPGGRGGGFRTSPGNPAIRPGSPFGRLNSGHPMAGFQRQYGGLGFPVVYPWSFPGFYENFGSNDSYGDGNQAPQVIIVAPQSEAPPPPPPALPPEPAQPVIHEYNWPASADNAARVFSLVSKDGTVRFAIAVWVQDGVLHYLPRDSNAERIPLDAIDRNATRLLNAQNGLNLSLSER